jgi:hypothetical protein
MGRAAHAGDELGAAIIAARLVRDVMRVLFCLRRQYPPYAKWFGSVFTTLEGAASLQPLLSAALRADASQRREEALCGALERLVALQRDAGHPVGVDARASNFFRRPFRVIWGNRIADAIFASITDSRLTALALRRIGNLDAISDNTDVLESTEIRARMRALFEP